MPLYEYQCEACGQRFEAIRKFSDPPLEICARCGQGPLARLQSSPAIQFKGSGWYITDYAQKGKSGPSSKESDGGAADSKGAAAGPTDGPAKADTPSSSPASSSPAPSSPASGVKD